MAQVRSQRGFSHLDDPEDITIYDELGKDAIKRADGNAYMFSLPISKNIKAKTKIGSGVFCAGQISNWLLNVEPNQPISGPGTHTP